MDAQTETKSIEKGIEKVRSRLTYPRINCACAHVFMKTMRTEPLQEVDSNLLLYHLLKCEPCAEHFHNSFPEEDPNCYTITGT